MQLSGPLDAHNRFKAYARRQDSRGSSTKEHPEAGVPQGPKRQEECQEEGQKPSHGLPCRRFLSETTQPPPLQVDPVLTKQVRAPTTQSDQLFSSKQEGVLPRPSSGHQQQESHEQKFDRQQQRDQGQDLRHQPQPEAEARARPQIDEDQAGMQQVASTGEEDVEQPLRVHLQLQQPQQGEEEGDNDTPRPSAVGIYGPGEESPCSLVIEVNRQQQQQGKHQEQQEQQQQQQHKEAQHPVDQQQQQQQPEADRPHHPQQQPQPSQQQPRNKDHEQEDALASKGGPPKVAKVAADSHPHDSQKSKWGTAATVAAAVPAFKRPLASHPFDISTTGAAGSTSAASSASGGNGTTVLTEGPAQAAGPVMRLAGGGGAAAACGASVAEPAAAAGPGTGPFACSAPAATAAEEVQLQPSSTCDTSGNPTTAVAASSRDNGPFLASPNLSANLSGPNNEWAGSAPLEVHNSNARSSNEPEQGTSPPLAVPGAQGASPAGMEFEVQGALSEAQYNSRTTAWISLERRSSTSGQVSPASSADAGADRAEAASTGGDGASVAGGAAAALVGAAAAAGGCSGASATDDMPAAASPFSAPPSSSAEAAPAPPAVDGSALQVQPNVSPPPGSTVVVTPGSTAALPPGSTLSPIASPPERYQNTIPTGPAGPAAAGGIAKIVSTEAAGAAAAGSASLTSRSQAQHLQPQQQQSLLQQEPQLQQQQPQQQQEDHQPQQQQQQQQQQKQQALSETYLSASSTRGVPAAKFATEAPGFSRELSSLPSAAAAAASGGSALDHQQQLQDGGDKQKRGMGQEGKGGKQEQKVDGGVQQGARWEVPRQQQQKQLEKREQMQQQHVEQVQAEQSQFKQHMFVDVDGSKVLGAIPASNSAPEGPISSTWSLPAVEAVPRASSACAVLPLQKQQQGKQLQLHEQQQEQRRQEQQRQVQEQQEQERQRQEQQRQAQQQQEQEWQRQEQQQQEQERQRQEQQRQEKQKQMQQQQEQERQHQQKQEQERQQRQEQERQQKQQHERQYPVKLPPMVMNPGYTGNEINDCLKSVSRAVSRDLLVALRRVGAAQEQGADASLLAFLMCRPLGASGGQVISPSRQEDLEELLVTANTLSWLLERVWKGSSVVEQLSVDLSRELARVPNPEDPRSKPRLLLQLVKPEDPEDCSSSSGLEVLEELANSLTKALLKDAGAEDLFAKLGPHSTHHHQQQQRGQGQLLPNERGLVQAVEYVMEQAVLLKLQLLATDAFMEVVLLDDETATGALAAGANRAFKLCKVPGVSRIAPLFTGMVSPEGHESGLRQEQSTKSRSGLWKEAAAAVMLPGRKAKREQDEKAGAAVGAGEGSVLGQRQSTGQPGPKVVVIHPQAAELCLRFV